VTGKAFYGVRFVEVPKVTYLGQSALTSVYLMGFVFYDVGGKGVIDRTVVQTFTSALRCDHMTDIYEAWHVSRT
jgi:hypothetical protein